MDWQELIDNCAKGNRPAFNEFVKKYYGLMHFLVSRKIANQGEHEDILQEVLLKFHRLNLFSKFRGSSEGEFRAYVAKICLNTISSYLGRQIASDDKMVYISPGDLEKLGLPNHHQGPLSEIMEKELMSRLEDAIAELPGNYRDIVNLRLLGNTNQEISEILRQPKGTIDSYSARALQLLQENLKDFASKWHEGRTYS